ncbi:hypothetical protein RJ639_023525 [Escallonia herrerae]|uniref:F-box domain-containing protein n=1 Tax=Escallonia herrerae TaxID=1293975 RepID=A0AA88V184_9ASTE|nr:hypothetical protein RJ639_023525 [Escallonia herrerae]
MGSRSGRKQRLCSPVQLSPLMEGPDMEMQDYLRGSLKNESSWEVIREWFMCFQPPPNRSPPIIMKPNIPRRPPQRCSTNGGGDRLSNLPHEILCHILSFLPTKNAVATSILSSRYSSLWSCIPVLDFHYQPHFHSPQKFVEFVNKVLTGNRSPSIDTFMLSFKNCTNLEPISSVNRWIEVVIKRSIVKMELSVFANHVVKGDECFGEFWFKFVALGLKKLYFVLQAMDDSPYYDLDFKIVIDAPRLEYLYVERDKSSAGSKHGKMIYAQTTLEISSYRCSKKTCCM